MLRCLRHWAGVGVVVTGLAFGVLATPGYLPAVGPPALRFRLAAPAATNLIQMALPPPDAPSPTLSTPPTPSGGAETENKPASPASNTASGSVTLAATNNPAPSDATSFGAEPRISPQMLLRYFGRPTNAPASGIIPPVDFAPPAPATPPSSTATYTTDPK